MARRHARVALPLLVALAGALACAPTAPAAVLEVSSEAIEGTGFGEVACIYRAEGVTEVEQPCEELEFETQKSIKLEAIPEPGSEFVHFQNGTHSASACNGKTSPCSFTLTEDSFIEARFDEITPALTIGKSGEGEVECEVEGSGLPEACEDEYAFETQVTLVPEPEPGWEFSVFKTGTGSAAACKSLTRPCSVVLERDSTIEAVFVPVMRSLTITKAGSGTGTVTCNGVTCASKYAQGAEVTLKATPGSGSTFAGWSGGGCTGTGSCVVAIEEEAVAVTATFTASSKPPVSLTITKAGSGTGAVACNGVTCASKYAQGTEVTLKATPASGSTFAGWSGGGCTGTGSCVVTIEEEAVAVTATFTANSKPPDPEEKSKEPKKEGPGTATAATVAKVKGGKARVRLSCSGGPCQGAVKLTARLRRGAGPVVIGRTPFTLSFGESTVLPVKLSAAAQSKLKKSGTLRARAAGTGVAAGAVKLKPAAR